MKKTAADDCECRAYERFWTEKLLGLPGVSDVNSQMIMKRIKDPAGVPLD